MENDIIDNAVIDRNLESYRQFFDHDWCKRVFEAVENSPLKDAIDTLMVAWRSANGAHVLPWLLVESLRRFSDGDRDGNLRARATYSGEVIRGIVEKLEARLNYSLDFNQRAQLRCAVTRIEEEAYQAFKTARSAVTFDVAGYWEFLTADTSEFPFCILGTQRMNYGSLFFAYEDFLANTIRTKEPAYSSKRNPIRDAFARHPLCLGCHRESRGSDRADRPMAGDRVGEGNCLPAHERGDETAVARRERPARGGFLSRKPVRKLEFDVARVPLFRWRAV
jgi:hypothetical protein